MYVGPTCPSRFENRPTFYLVLVQLALYTAVMFVVCFLLTKGTSKLLSLNSLNFHKPSFLTVRGSISFIALYNTVRSVVCFLLTEGFG